MSEIRLITLDPGHFHAALVQKEMHPGVARQSHVYAPLGPDLLAHLRHIAGFNTRLESPTSWELEIHAAPEFLERMLRERPGDVVVLSGHNRHKIDYILAAARAGLHVLADKPWIIHAADMPRLAEALTIAEEQGLIAYDIMTERYEITSVLQRDLLQDVDIFGEVAPGTIEEPGVVLESVHYLKKLVAGIPLRRPPRFFDIHQEGEGLADVGTHLVDLVPWMLFPALPILHEQDVRLLGARRWPTVLSREEFRHVTGEDAFPADLADVVEKGRLHYYCNNEVRFTVRGVHTRLTIAWDYEAVPGGGDTHYASLSGTRSRVEVRQGPEQRFRPELYVIPNRTGDKEDMLAALREKVAGLGAAYAGVAVVDLGGELKLDIPAALRTGHEAHFAEVTRQFLSYLNAPHTFPAWEKPNMLAKYFLTTAGVERSRHPT